MSSQPKKKTTTHEELARVWDVWAKRLNLGHWQFEIDTNGEPEDEDHDAEITMADAYNEANVVFAPGWQRWSRQKLNEVVAHELLHCHLHQLWVASQVPKIYLGLVAADMYEKRVLNELEMVCESLATNAVAEFGCA